MTSWAVLGRFFHGLTFFTLSLTVVFLQYRSQRILLARRLSWLGLFAVFEAAVAWNNLFAALMPGLTFLPHFARPALLATGYTFLIAFGIQTFFSEGVSQGRARRMLLWLNLVWFAPYAVVLASFYPNVDAPAQSAEVLVRYLLAFPAGVITAIGLRRQSHQALEPKLRLRIRPYLRLIEAMVGMFGVLNLILVPSAPFFPASRLNIDVFYPLPCAWLWGVVGAGLTVGLVRALTTVEMEIENWIEGVERLQTLATDRERIGRELHDGIIQSIYASGLLLESLQRVIPIDPMRAQAQLGRVMDNLNETIQDIRRYIFDLRSDMPDDNLPSGLGRLLRDFRINTLLETELEVTGTPVAIASVERRRHIFQIVREALANTARHARANSVKIELGYNEDALDITISDDGVGMETLLIGKGYGLRNIRERVRLLDGTLRIESAPDEGVTFQLTVPY